MHQIIPTTMWCDTKDEVVVWKKMLPPLFKYRYSRRCVGWTFHRLNKSHVPSLVCHISVEQTGALHRRVGLVNTSQQQIKSDNPMLHICVWILVIVDSCNLLFPILLVIPSSTHCALLSFSLSIAPTGSVCTGGQRWLHPREKRTHWYLSFGRNPTVGRVGVPYTERETEKWSPHCTSV